MRFLPRRAIAPDMIGSTPPSWHLHRYLQGSANLFEENRLLKFAVLGLFGVSAVLGLVIYTSNQNQRTITRNIVALSGTYSAYSADPQFQELLSLVHPGAYNGLRDSLSRLLDELGTNPTLSIATYIRSDQPVSYTGSEILVPVEKVRVIGGVIRKFLGQLRIRFVVDNGRFWLTALQEENFNADPR